MTTSTRRFCCRPAADSLSATGEFSPRPAELSRAVPTPWPTRNRVGTALREVLVVLLAAHAVGEPFDRSSTLRVFRHKCAQPIQVRRGAGFQLRPSGGEQGVTQRQNQSAIRRTRLQDLELTLQQRRLLLRGIGRKLRGLGVGFRKIRFMRTGIEARLFALLIERDALSLCELGLRQGGGRLLKRRGLVQSKRGKNGGYALLKPASAIFPEVIRSSR